MNKVILDKNGKTMDTSDYLKAAKDEAFQMVKTASYGGSMLQDPYPSPYLSLSDTDIPERTADILRWCRYYYMFDPLIAGAINSLASFPITDVYLEDIESQEETDEESPQLSLYKRIIFKKMNIYKLLIEIGIDYWLYGNCFIFGEFEKGFDGNLEWKHITRLDPSKMIIDVNPATLEKKYKWRVPDRVKKIIQDKKPKEEYELIPDVIKRAVKDGKAVVLKDENIYHFARPSDSMGESSWGTPSVANVLKLLMYRNVLRQAQEAIAREHIVPFRVYYLDRVDGFNPQGDWSNTAKAFAGELMKAAKDPNYKVVSPVPVNLINVGGHGKSLLLTPEIEQVQAEILAGMNVPREFIFGGVSYSGSSISLKILENHFITYRLLIKDFLQNFIIRNMAKARREWTSYDDDKFLVSVKMSDLKMQDDVQQKQLIVNLNAAGKVTDETLWKVLGIDPEKMRDSLKKELIYRAELEAEVEAHRVKHNLGVQKIQMQAQFELQRYQMELQQQYGMVPDQGMDQGQEEMEPEQEQEVEQGAPEEKGQQEGQVSEQELIAFAEKLLGLPPEERKAQLQQLPPEVKKKVMQIMKELEGQQYQGQGFVEAQKIALQIKNMPQGEKQQVLAKLPENLKQKVLQIIEQMKAEQQTERESTDMRQMPEQRPPRRDSVK